MGYSENELPLQLAIDLKRYYPDLVRVCQNRLNTFAYRLTGSPQRVSIAIPADRKTADRKEWKSGLGHRIT